MNFLRLRIAIQPIMKSRICPVLFYTVPYIVTHYAQCYQVFLSIFATQYVRFNMVKFQMAWVGGIPEQMNPLTSPAPILIPSKHLTTNTVRYVAVVDGTLAILF